MKTLRLHEDYGREDVHDIFDPDSTFTPQAGTWGLQGIIMIPDRPGDFVFFVTFGRREGEHEFDEGISTEGVLRWQSKPQQRLNDPQVTLALCVEVDTHPRRLRSLLQVQLRGHRPSTAFDRATAQSS